MYYNLLKVQDRSRDFQDQSYSIIINGLFQRDFQDKSYSIIIYGLFPTTTIHETPCITQFIQIIFRFMNF